MKRTRWTGRILGGLLALAPATGCKRQIFLEPADYKTALEAGTLGKLEMAPGDAITPPVIQPGQSPATVLDPERPAKYLTLKECVAVALEQGNAGFQPNNNPGVVLDNLPQFNGRGTTGTDTIKAFALQPAIAGAEIERSLSKFDARYISSMTWQKVDQAQAAQFTQSLNNGDQATLATTLAKPLPTGGVAGISFNTTYRNLSNPPTTGQISSLPTSYSPQLQFTFEQPLLQNFGVEVNQLLQAHPGSILIPGLQASGGTGSEGILVTRIRLDQARAEFDRNVNNMLYNLETAYWNLYSAYYNLFAQNEGLKQSYDAYRIITERAEGGLARPQNLYQYRAQVELFQAQVITARGQVLTAERSLRGFMGMRSDDGTRLVPVDEPTVVPYNPDFYQLANEAMQWRPELMIARQDLKSQQLNLVLQRNLRRPDLRLLSQYDVNAIGTRLDGEVPTNAFGNLARNDFNNFQVGLRLNMPIGFRDANALVRQAELNIKTSYYYLTDAERKCVENLTEQYRLVFQSHEIIKRRRAQREALETFVAKNLQVFLTGAVGQGEFEGFIANLVQAQRDLANATGTEFQAIAQYNTALAGVEFAKGTTQRYNNVLVSDGPAPPWVEKKAADHFKGTEAAFKLREHPAELQTPIGDRWAPLTDLPPNAGPVGVPPPPPNAESGFDKTDPAMDGKTDGKGQPLPTPQKLPTEDPTPKPPAQVLQAIPPARGVPAATTTGFTPVRPAAADPVPAGGMTFTQTGTVTIQPRAIRPAGGAAPVGNSGGTTSTTFPPALPGQTVNGSPRGAAFP
jgi:outer membrane protein TolC